MSVAARAGLAGNPSDGYGGRVVGVPIPNLVATARAGDEVMDHEMRALIDASRAELVDRWPDHADEWAAIPVAVATDIPRSVGLAGSSAIILAVIRLLGSAVELRLSPEMLASLAHHVEVHRLGVPAGLQDRVVQSFGRPMDMDFAALTPLPGPAAGGLVMGRYRVLEPPGPLPAFLAWRASGTESSAVVHQELTTRHDAGDEELEAVVTALADQAASAARALTAGRWDDLGVAMDASVGLRARIVDLRADHLELVEAARRLGVSVNYAGSGGSIVGLHHRVGFDAVAEALRSVGAEVVTIGARK